MPLSVYLALQVSSAKAPAITRLQATVLLVLSGKPPLIPLALHVVVTVFTARSVPTSSSTVLWASTSLP